MDLDEVAKVASWKVNLGKESGSLINLCLISDKISFRHVLDIIHYVIVAKVHLRFVLRLNDLVEEDLVSALIK